MTFNNIFPSQGGQILLFSFLQFNNKKDIYYVKKISPVVLVCYQ